MGDAKKSTPVTVPDFKIRAQGDRCLSIDFGSEIDVQTGLLCLATTALLREAKLAGVTDIVPSYTSVALHYQPDAHSEGANFHALSKIITSLIQAGIPSVSTDTREVEIPVCYGGEHGPDLTYVAQTTGLTENQVIDIHTKPGSMVFMLGFAPGAPYIGVHDPIFALPRRDVPRTAVPAGSVAIANRQSTIYPNRLPGGWHVLGATPLKLFDLNSTPPTLLMPGDRVKFVPISAEEFDRIAAQQAQEILT